MVLLAEIIQDMEKRNERMSEALQFFSDRYPQHKLSIEEWKSFADTAVFLGIIFEFALPARIKLLKSIGIPIAQKEFEGNDLRAMVKLARLSRIRMNHVKIQKFLQQIMYKLITDDVRSLLMSQNPEEVREGWEIFQTAYFKPRHSNEKKVPKHIAKTNPCQFGYHVHLFKVISYLVDSLEQLEERVEMFGSILDDFQMEIEEMKKSILPIYVYSHTKDQKSKQDESKKMKSKLQKQSVQLTSVKKDLFSFHQKEKEYRKEIHERDQEVIRLQQELKSLEQTLGCMAQDSHFMMISLFQALKQKEANEVVTPSPLSGKVICVVGDTQHITGYRSILSRKGAIPIFCEGFEKYKRFRSALNSSDGIIFVTSYADHTQLRIMKKEVEHSTMIFVNHSGLKSFESGVDQLEHMMSQGCRKAI